MPVTLSADSGSGDQFMHGGFASATPHGEADRPWWPLVAHILRESNTQRLENPLLGLALAGIVVGAVAGLVARCALPAAQPAGGLSMVAVGVMGAFGGGFLGFLLFGTEMTDEPLGPTGLTGLTIGAIVALINCLLLVRNEPASQLSMRVQQPVGRSVTTRAVVDPSPLPAHDRDSERRG